MPLTCNHANCDAATICRNSRDVEDGQTVEKYECGNGHIFHETFQG